MQRTIAIIGHGYVGAALERFFAPHYSIVLYDPPKGYADRAAVNAADVALISVPTPQGKDGSVDLSFVEETLRWLDTPLTIIKSTVPPGTTERLARRKRWEDCLVFSPEYIGEGKYPLPYWQDLPHPTDMSLHSFHIFGGTAPATAKAIELFKRPAGPFARFVQTDSTTAELTKYMENAWIATKITFVNEFFEIARSFGVDYSQLRELWLLDGRVGRSHTLVYADKRGFDGKCIPKDTSGIARACRANGAPALFIESVLAANRRFSSGPAARKSNKRPAK